MRSAGLLRSSWHFMRRLVSTNCEGFREIGWKSSKATAPVDIRSELMTSGGFALRGGTEIPMKLKSSTTTVEKMTNARRRKRDIAPVHPGEILKLEFLEPLELSINALSRAIKVPRPRLNDIVRGRRGITADTAMRLACYFSVSAQFWMNLQSHYELEVAEETIGKRLGREIRPHAA